MHILIWSSLFFIFCNTHTLILIYCIVSDCLFFSHRSLLTSWLLVIRYGKVQSVKILPARIGENANNSSGNTVCATVAFIDIRSASKAHNGENKIEDKTLKTDYYEPPASSTASSAIYIHETREDALLVHRQQQQPPPPSTSVNNISYGNSQTTTRSARHTPSRG